MIMTMQELRDKYKVSKPTVYKWIKQGMPIIKKERTLRFDDLEVENWMKDK